MKMLLMGSLLVLAACAPAAEDKVADSTAPAVAGAMAPGSAEQIAFGRDLVIKHGCGDCHGGGSDPAAKGWLAGVMSPQQVFHIGACNVENPKGQPCWAVYPRNLTPDDSTGLGRFTERQIFNAMRFGLRPEATPDVEITGNTPGVGNFPNTPHYLAPPMPWAAWRHMSDQELNAIAAYLKHGLLPVANKVKESDGPPDFWASTWADSIIGPYPAKAFPTANEKGN